MAWTNPRTWVAGELVTAAQFNTHIRDNELDLDARAHHVLQHDQTTAGTPANTSETVLHTFSIPANYFAVTGRTVRLTVHGTSSTNNVNIVRVRLGGASGSVVFQADTNWPGVWWLQGLVSRVGLNTLWAAFMTVGMAHGSSSAQGGVHTEVESNPLDLVITGQNSAAFGNDLIYQSGWLERMGA